MKSLRIVLADEHRMFADALSYTLRDQCEVVEIVEDGRSLLESVKRVLPDAVILEIGLPLLNGLDAGRQIKTQFPHIKLIYLTVFGSPTYVKKAMDLGASGYVLKKSTLPELMQALELTERGLCYLTPFVTKGLLHGLVKGEWRVRGGIDMLTSRQREIVQLVAEGFTLREMAKILALSPKTIMFHKANVMAKLKLTGTAGLTRFAIENGLLLTQADTTELVRSLHA